MERVVLLADKNSNAWGFAEKIKDYLEKNKQVKLPLLELELGHFRNGEIDMYAPENLRKKDAYFVHDSSLNPQEWWVQLLLIKDLALRASVESLTFVLPNMNYSRQDRKHKSRTPISAKALADSLTYPPVLSRIITMDLHAEQIQGFYNIPVDTLRSFPSFAKYLGEHPEGLAPLEKLVIVSPDAGGANRVESLARRLGSEYPIAVIDKRRAGPGEIEKMNLAGEVSDRDALIVDDIIDSGGTLCKAAESLRQNGARKVSCYGTHGIFTNGTSAVIKYFDRTIITNTINVDSSGVERIDVSPIFAEAIYRAQRGVSISKLFE